MIPNIQLWKIVRGFVRRLKTSRYNLAIDEKEIWWHRIGQATDLEGLFIPQSVYYSIENIESHTLHELRDVGIYSDDEFEFMKKLDKVQLLDEEQWPQAIKEHIDDERKAIHEQQRKS